MDKDNIKQFPTRKQDEEVMEERELTAEEIQFITERDEAELAGYLKKFQAVALPDSSKVEEEDDEEEETITLDFTEEGVKAYEKVGEGVAVRDEDGNVSLVEDEELADKIKKVLDKEEEPRLKKKYDTLLHDLFIIKAVSSLIRKLRDTEDEMLESLGSRRMGGLGDLMEKTITDESYNRRIELRSCIAGDRVNYDKIPQWAENYIEEYMRDAIGGLVELTERD